MSAPTLSRPEPGGPPPAESVGPRGPVRPRAGAERGRADARRTVLVAAGCLLGLIPLKAIFTDWTWLVEVLAFTAVLLGPAALWRLRRRPALWQVLPGVVLAAAFWWLLYLEPGAATLGTVDLVRALHEQAADLVRTSGTPLASTSALRMEVVPGLALVTVVIDWCAVVRRAPALAGIPLLAVFTTAGAIAGSVHWWQFAASASGYLLMLAADSRDVLLRWGRVVPRRRGDTLARPNLGLSGRRIGIIAVVVAVLLPLTVPGLSRNLLSEALNGHGGSGSGNGNGTALSPLAALKGQLTRGEKINLFSVRLHNTTGAFYLRSKVLEQYTPSGWVTGRDTGSRGISSQSVAAIGIGGGTRRTFSADIDIDRLRDTGAPIFATPTSIRGLSGWSVAVQQGVLVDNRTTGSTGYTEQVSEPAATQSELDAATGSVSSVPSRLRALPAGLPPLVGRTVASVSAGYRTPYRKAQAIQDYFRTPSNGFTYTLSTTDGDSGSDLGDFLTNKQGYCQQYAAAMAVMLRVAGIPSRVVLGYTHADPDDSGRFTVTNHDSHAWVEAYFAGIGWYPFDPTPLSGSDAGRAQAPSNAPSTGGPDGPSGGSEPSAPTSSGKSSSGAAPQRPEQQTQAAGPAPAGSSGLPGWLVPTVAALAAVIVLVSLAPGLRLATRRRRIGRAHRSGQVEPLWQELRASAADLGLAWSPSTTPRQVVPYLTDRGAPADGLGRLARAVEQERYGTGGQAAGTTEVSAGEQRVRSAVRALRASASRRRRLRARLLPASLRDLTRRGHRADTGSEE